MGQERCLSGLLSVMYRKLTRIIGTATKFAEGRIKHKTTSAKKYNSLSDGLNFQTYTSTFMYI
jgi:isocitrate/isopropylmalate dehydrogenase